MTDHQPSGTDVAHGEFGLDDVGLDSPAASRLARELVTRVSDGLRQRSGDWQAIGRDAIGALCDAVLAPHPLAAAEHLSALQARGVSMDALYSGYLAGAAHELGRLWEDDRIGFADVTLGMSRLQRCMRELSPAYIGDRRPRVPPIRILLAAAPGENHIFGTVMMGDQLRRVGWQVQLDVSGEADRVLAAAEAGDRLDVIGLSVGSACIASTLASLVRDLRDRSRGPAPLIVIGGALAHVDAEMARNCGADAVARSVRELSMALDASQARRQSAA